MSRYPDEVESEMLQIGDNCNADELTSEKPDQLDNCTGLHHLRFRPGGKRAYAAVFGIHDESDSENETHRDKRVRLRSTPIEAYDNSI